jgi:glyoxylase-like metal-dependent hydrolase (beta-lactamase superfamily II)
MRTHRRTLLATAALLPRTSRSQPAPAAPLIRPEGLRQLAPHVSIIPDNSVPLVPNVGFVVGDERMLVIDTGLGPRNGAVVAQLAQRLGGQRAPYLVTTHVHPEHDLGASAFPAGTQLIRSTDQLADISEFGLSLAKIFAARSPEIAALLQGADFRAADITFDRDHDLDLGGVQARIVALGANHTRGDTAVWVMPDRVLFAGDVAMQAQPSFASPHSSLRHWLESLDRLAALGPAIVVPSHGPVGDQNFIAGYRTYLTEVQDRTTAAKRGGSSLDQAIASVTAAMVGRYPDRGRLAGAIRSAFAEAA